MMNEELYDELGDLEFNMTIEMRENFIETLITRELLESETNKKKRKLLERHFERLREEFITEFRKNNQLQLEIIKAFFE